MILGEELTIRLERVEGDGTSWAIRSRSRSDVYVTVFIPKTARREERAQRFAFAIGDALEQCERNV